MVAENSQKFQFAYDSESGKYGYKAKVEGADTFFPFSSIDKIALFNGEFLNTDIATIKHNATLSNGKIISSSTTTGIWINNFNITNPENYVIVFEFTSTPSSPQIGYCSTTASLPTIVSSGSGRLGYNTGSSYTSNYSCQLINGQGIYAGFVGTLETIYLLKIK